MLKKLWPTPYKVKAWNILSLVVQLLIFIVICAVMGVLIKILAAIPIVNIIAWVLGLCMEVYSVVGIVLCVLNFLGILK